MRSSLTRAARLSTVALFAAACATPAPPPTAARAPARPPKIASTPVATRMPEEFRTHEDVDTSDFFVGQASTERARKSTALAAITEKLVYPKASRARGDEGTVVVELIVDHRGRLVGRPGVLSTSGFEELDKAALRTVMEAGTFLPARGEEGGTYRLALPIRFRIDRTPKG
jgi:TonB family protein